MDEQGLISDLVAARAGRKSGTILVTGGAGYIGSLLVRRLLSRGYKVRVLDSLLYGIEPLRGVLDHPSLDLMTADFRIPTVVEAATEGIDAAIHLGAIVGDPACALAEDFAIDCNYEATRSIVASCRRRKIARMIFASTCSVYGASDGALDETSALNPVSLYANTKIAAEKMILAARTETFAPTILRFATAYGASHRPRFDLVVNLLTAKAVAEGYITIHGGQQWRPFVHVDDIARALVLTLEAPLDQVSGETFNLGSTGQNFRLAEVGETIRQIVPSAEVATNEAIVDRRNYFVRFDKIQRTLGFKPEHDLRSAIVEMADALRLGKIGDYRDRQYNNFRFLSEADPGVLAPREYSSLAS